MEVRKQQCCAIIWISVLKFPLENWQKTGWISPMRRRYWMRTTTVSVSYTHLDVYKRQVAPYRQGRRFPARWEASHSACLLSTCFLVLLKDGRCIFQTMVKMWYFINNSLKGKGRNWGTLRKEGAPMIYILPFLDCGVTIRCSLSLWTRRYIFHISCL